MIKAIKEEMWLNGISSELGLFNNVITIYCDNQITIYLAKKSIYHEKFKHIDVRFHFVRYILLDEKIKL